MTRQLRSGQVQSKLAIQVIAPSRVSRGELVEL